MLCFQGPLYICIKHLSYDILRRSIVSFGKKTDLRLHLRPEKFAPVIFNFLLTRYLFDLKHTIKAYYALGLSKVFYTKKYKVKLKNWREAGERDCTFIYSVLTLNSLKRKWIK